MINNLILTAGYLLLFTSALIGTTFIIARILHFTKIIQDPIKAFKFKSDTLADKVKQGAVQDEITGDRY